MRKFFLSALLLVAISCQVKPDESRPEKEIVPDAVLSIPAIAPTTNPPASREVIESYSDEYRIGRRRQNRIEIDIVNNGPFRGYHPTNLAVIRFYSRNQSRKWELKQTLEIEDGAIEEAAPTFEDFNNDGLKDITFISNTAARGRMLSEHC